jgi:hypothetical protein
MSTFFAIFDDLNSARNMLDELVRGGVRPDDVSLVTRQVLEGNFSSSVGDASAFVGREDDPVMDEVVSARNKNLSDLSTAVEATGTMGIDTSQIGRDVESVDQNDDSQSASEDMLEPPRMTTQSEHERDDLGLALLTGFPTTVPLQDDVIDSEGKRQDQFAQSLETISLPGAGTVIGGGAMATAAFDVINPQGGDSGRLGEFLRDEGVEEEAAEEYRAALEANQVLIAIAVAPGEIREEAIESIAERSGARSGRLYDAPRFHENGGYAA